MTRSEVQPLREQQTWQNMTPLAVQQIAHPVTPCLFVPNVLVIESHPVLAEMLFWMLALTGYRATVTTKEAIMVPTWIEDQMGLASPVLLLIDVDSEGKPYLDDLFFPWCRLCAHWGVVALPMLLLASGPDLLTELMLAGFSALGKPFHLSALRNLVHTLIKQHQPTFRNIMLPSHCPSRRRISDEQLFHGTRGIVYDRPDRERKDKHVRP